MSDGKEDITISGYDYSDYNIDVDSIDLSNINIGDITIDTSYHYGSSGSNTISITGGGSGTVLASNGTSWATSNISSTSAGIHVDGDANFEGDIKWQGRSLGDMLSKIESRLAILTPDLEKLEHFAALKKAYDHYKALEALCELPKEDEDENS